MRLMADSTMTIFVLCSSIPIALSVDRYLTEEDT